MASKGNSARRTLAAVLSVALLGCIPLFLSRSLFLGFHSPVNPVKGSNFSRYWPTAATPHKVKQAKSAGGASAKIRSDDSSHAAEPSAEPQAPQANFEAIPLPAARHQYFGSEKVLAETKVAGQAGRPTPAATPAVAGRQARRLLFQDKHQAVRKQLPAAIASLRAPSVTGLAAAVTPEGQAAVKAWATGCEGGCSCALGCDSDPGELNVVALLVGEDGGGWGGYTVPSSAADVVSGWQSESDAARKGGGVVPQSCLAALVCTQSPKPAFNQLHDLLKQHNARVGRLDVQGFASWSLGVTKGMNEPSPPPAPKASGGQRKSPVMPAVAIPDVAAHVPTALVQKCDMLTFLCRRCAEHHMRAWNKGFFRSAGHMRMTQFQGWEGTSVKLGDVARSMTYDASEQVPHEELVSARCSMHVSLLKHALNQPADLSELSPEWWARRATSEAQALLSSMCVSTLPGFRVFTQYASDASLLWGHLAKFQPNATSFGITMIQNEPPLPSPFSPAAVAAQQVPTAAPSPSAAEAQQVPAANASRALSQGNGRDLKLRFTTAYWRFMRIEDRGFDEKLMFGACPAKCSLVTKMDAPLDGAEEGAVMMHMPKIADTPHLVMQYGAAIPAPNVLDAKLRTTVPYAPYILPQWIPKQPPRRVPQLNLMQLESAFNHGEDYLRARMHTIVTAFGPGRSRVMSLSNIDGQAPYVDHAQLGLIYVPSTVLDPLHVKLGMNNRTRITTPSDPQRNMFFQPTPVFSTVQNCMDITKRRTLMAKLTESMKRRGYPAGIHHHGDCLRNKGAGTWGVEIPEDFPGWYLWGDYHMRIAIKQPWAQMYAKHKCFLEEWKQVHATWLGDDLWRPCVHSEHFEKAGPNFADRAMHCPRVPQEALDRCAKQQGQAAPKPDAQQQSTMWLSNRDHLYKMEAGDQVLRGLYKFGMAVENSNCRQYVTEKPYVMLNGGAIPIVRSNRGVPAYPRHLPPASYVDTAWFRLETTGLHTDSMAAFIDITHRNPSVYWLMHEWRRHWPWTLRDVSMAGTPSERQTPPYLNGDPLRCLTVWRVDLEDARGRLGAEKLAAGVQAVGVVDLVASACASLGGSPEVHCELLVNVTRRLSEEVVLMRTVGQPDCGGDALTRAFTELGQPESFATTTGNVWCDICDDMHADRQWSEDEKRVLQWRQGSGGKPELVVGSPIRLGADDALHPSQCN